MHKIFDFEASLPFIKPQVEEFVDVDASIIKYTFKRIDLSDHLSIFLCEDGQATLEFDSNELITFYWNDEVEQMIRRVDKVSISEFFRVIEAN